MKFRIAAVALLVGNGLALTQEEQVAADQAAVGVQETPENINDVQVADDDQNHTPKAYGGGAGPHRGGSSSSPAGFGGYGHRSAGSDCKDDVRRVKATLEDLLRQVEHIRCDSCHKPKPTQKPQRASPAYPKPTTAPRPTSIYAQPTTTKKKACATPTCGKQGVKFNRYSNPFARDFSSSYKSFDLQYFLKQKPLESGVVHDISLVSDPSNKTFANAAMEYRTFLFACQSGKYKFTAPKSDDITLMWFGDHVKEPTRENAYIFQAWYGDNKPRTVYKHIKAGVYYPIRILWGNTNGAGYLNLEIISPEGNQLTGHNGKSYVVTENCQASNPYGDVAKTASGAGASKPTGSSDSGAPGENPIGQGTAPSGSSPGGDSPAGSSPGGAGPAGGPRGSRGSYGKKSSKKAQSSYDDAY